MLNKLGIGRNFLNLIKGIYQKPTADIILNDETESFPLKIRNKTRMCTFTTYIQQSTGDSSKCKKSRQTQEMQKKHLTKFNMAQP